MDKIDNVARMAIKITLKHEKLQRMLNDKIVRALVDDVFKEDPKDYLEKLHLKIIPLKMQIVSKMYEVKSFEEVEMDINLSNLKYQIDGENIVK